MKDYKTVFVNTDGANFPDTAGVNASGGGATDGTEFVKLFIDDLWGVAQAIMDFAGYTPDAVQESATASQRLQAILKFIKPIVVDVTGDITLSDERPNQLIRAVKQAGDITITLPDASAGNFVQQTIVINVTGAAAGSVLLLTSGAQTIDGLTPGNFDFTLPGQKTFVSDGANWISKRNTVQEAKAWVNFDGTGVVAIRDSFNVSSITDNGVGDYTVNFTNAMSNADYVVLGSATGTVILGSLTLLTNSAQILTHGHAGGVIDSNQISITIHSQ